MQQKNEKQQNTISSKKQKPTKNGLPFSLLAKAYSQVGNCRGQNSKQNQKNILMDLFKQLLLHSVQDLTRGYWLSILKIGPDYQRYQLGIGKQILVKSIARSCGMSQKQIRQKNTQIGDFGEVALMSKSSQKTMDSYFIKKAPEPLTIEQVFNTLRKISQCKGNNSNSTKQNLLIDLMLKSTGEQMKFIIRWVQGNLKILAGQKTMQKALMTVLYQQLVPVDQQNQQTQIQFQQMIKKSAAQYPNDAQIIKNLVNLKSDYKKLSQICKLSLGVPCRPMLAKPTRGIGDILNRFQGKRLTCQYKYDGLRGQVHYNQGKIQIFSRNLQNLTDAYADIIQQINKNLPAITQAGLKSFIIDCQIVAINKQTKQLLPFQVLATRARKKSNINQIQVFVNLFAFDILYYNQPITHLTLKQRRQYLLKMQAIFNNIIRLSQHKQLQDFDSIDQFLQDAIKFGTQGLMIKDMDSVYTCSRRSWQWVKLKKDYINGLGDTLDVVPIGGFYGVGKRTGFYGSYLLAIYNSDMQQYQTICKIGTGFSDQVLKQAHQMLKDKVVPQCPKDYKISSGMQKCDVWFTPTVVWQIKGADFQISPVHTCAIGDTGVGKGIGLRFPRLIKVRQDKKPFQASSNQFVYDLYKQQAVVQNQNKDDQDDYY